MKRILVYGMTDNPGGIETFLINLMEKLMPYGIYFDFITDSPSIVHEDKLKRKGSIIYYIPTKSKNLFGHLNSCLHIFHNHPEYEIMYMNLLNAGGVVTTIIPKLYRKKIIVHSHNGDADNKKLHLICRPLLRIITDNYIACSKLAAEYMFGKKISLSNNVIILPNAIDAIKFDFNQDTRTRLREKWHLENNFVICHVGRIAYQKNPYAVINIFQQIYKEDSTAKLLYIGNGDMESEIKQYAKDIGIVDQICFWGIRNDISDILQASDVFLLPSRYEGLPISALEAQAAGLPCVLSDVISSEIIITNNVEQLSLNDDWKVWSKTILKYKNMKRKSVYSLIAASGYDLSTSNPEIEKLIGILNGK